MRVAIVQEHLDPRRGGAETSVREMAGQLARLGADVTIVCASADDDRRVPVKIVNAGGMTKLARTRRFIDAADEVCRSDGFDIVHAVTPCRSCNVYQPRGGTYAETIQRSRALAGGGLSGRVRAWARSLNARQRFLLELEHSLLSAAVPPFVAAVSGYVRRQVLEAFRAFPADRARVVFNGVDVEPLPADQVRRERAAVRARLEVGAAPLALFVAHNFRLKGLAELLRAAATPTGQDAGFHIAVAGRDRPAAYRRLADSLGIAPRVRFVGATTPMRSLYAAADLLAHPTWYDPCSRVVLEALGFGLPVVTTRFNGAAEIVAESGCGAVVDDPRYADELAAAVTCCGRQTMREQARAAAPEMRLRLSMERHARELLSLYEMVRPKR